MLVTGHPWRSTLDYEGQPENQHGVHLNLAARLSKGWGPSLVCSHEAKRENPLELELTPAVTLTVALDDTAGTAT